MQGVSPAFAAAVQKSHQAVCRMDVIRNGQVVMTLPVVDGEVTADGTAAQMRSFRATIADPDHTLTPEKMGDLFSPFTTRVQLYRGIRIPNVETATDTDNTVTTWGEGTNNGTVADPATGHLILGWT